MPAWFDDEVRALRRRTGDRRGEDKLILFYGSSTFTLWSDLEAYFPAHNVVNHGFGGSTLSDCLEYFDQLVTPLAPAAIVLYAGDNDLDNGASPENVLGLLDQFLARKRAALGAVPLAYVSIKISVARLHFMHKIGYTNRIAERRLAGEPDARFVDFTRRLVGRGYHPWSGYFTHDPLHMNDDGYRVLGKTLAEYISGLESVVGGLAIRRPRAAPRWAAASDGKESGR
jgi:lysophospholipase L1-like esterase